MPLPWPLGVSQEEDEDHHKTKLPRFLYNIRVSPSELEDEASEFEAISPFAGPVGKELRRLAAPSCCPASYSLIAPSFSRLIRSLPSPTRTAGGDGCFRHFGWEPGQERQVARGVHCWGKVDTHGRGRRERGAEKVGERKGFPLACKKKRTVHDSYSPAPRTDDPLRGLAFALRPRL